MVLLAAATLRVLPAAAQIGASVGLGVGTVRYPGGSSLGSAMLSPGVHYTADAVGMDASASLASLPGSVWSSQARASVWGTTPPFDRNLRLGGEATFAGTTLNGGGGSTAAAHGLVEVVWGPSPNWGIGLAVGPSTGMISGTLPVVALHTRARSWWRPGGAADAPDVQLLVEPTRFPAGWFTDASATATVERGRTILSLSLAGRVSATYGSKAAGSASLQWFVKPRVALEVGGGSVLNDPYQDLPRTGFIFLGVRLHRSPRPAPDGGARTLAPLVAEMRGDSVVLRFRMAGARSVAIAGDWNAWGPRMLRPLGEDVWESTLVLRRGLYHFNLVVDGSDWVVPNGVATVSDGLGGLVAVLIVP